MDPERVRKRFPKQTEPDKSVFPAGRNADEKGRFICES